MNYDLVEVVIDKLVRTFRLREWQYDIEDCVEDIAEALKLIGAAKIYAEKAVNVPVKDMMARLPQDVQNIKYVNEECQYYRESGSFIEIDVPDGEVTIVYQAMPTDTRGYPLVPDSAPVREAVMWFLVKTLTLQKEITHVSFSVAEGEWQWRCLSARAYLNAINLQQANMMYQNFTRLNPLKNVHENNYKQLTSGNSLDRTKYLDNHR